MYFVYFLLKVALFYFTLVVLAVIATHPGISAPFVYIVM